MPAFNRSALANALASTSSSSSSPSSSSLSPEAASFDDDTSSLVCQLHAAWRSNAPVSTYAEIRDQLLAEHDVIGTRIATLSAVTRIACPYASLKGQEGALDAVWKHFFSIAETIDLDADDAESVASSNAAVRLPGPARHKRASDEAIRLRDLAVTAALWSSEVVWHYGWNRAGQSQMKRIRACATVYPRFQEDFGPRVNAVLLARHCKAILSGRRKPLNEARFQPSRDFDLSRLASLPIDRHREAQWLDADHGTVPLDDKGTVLEHVRPHHSHLYLLTKDHYGILVARACQESRPSFSSTASSLTSAFPSAVTNPSASPLSLSTPSTFPSTFAPLSASPPSVMTPSHNEPSTQLHDPIIDGWLDSNVYNDTLVFDVPRPAPYLFTADPRVSDRRGISKKHGTTRPSRRASLMDPTRLLASASPPTTPSARSSRLVIGRAPSVRCGESPSSMEVSLHGKYQAKLSSYVEQLSGEVATRAGRPDRLGHCAQWLTSDTELAKTWTSEGLNVRPGGSSCEQEADVLYYSPHDFTVAATNGKRFRTPVVIKETFADAGMHTVQGFASLIQDAFRDTAVDIASDAESAHSGSTYPQVSINVSHSGRVFKGLKAFRVHNITNAHKPLLTMLRRFRLLVNLAERHKSHQSRRQQITTTSSPWRDVYQCPGFNVLMLPGGNPTTHVDALSGIWMRNLQGLALFTFVPEHEMTYDDGLRKCCVNDEAEWDPDGKQRLIVLEEHDVLLIPPGVHVARQMQSPTSCLIEGGTLWDDLAIVESLQLMCWSLQNGPVPDERLRHDVSCVLKELEVFVLEQPERFRGTMSEGEFETAFARAMGELTALFTTRARLFQSEPRTPNLTLVLF